MNSIRTVDYELRQQERADSNKAERRKRAENKELAGLRSKVQELTNQITSAESSKDEELLDLRSKLEETKRTLANLKQDLTDAKQEADMACKAAAEMQERLKLTNGIIEQLPPALSPERRTDCASELFQKFTGEQTLRQRAGEPRKAEDGPTWSASAN